MCGICQFGQNQFGLEPLSSERLLGGVSLAWDLTDISKLSSSFGARRLLISVGFLFLRIFLDLVRSLFVLLADFVEPLHVLEEIGAALESDEKLGFLAVIPVVGGGLHVNCLGPNRGEGGVIVPKVTKSEFMIERVRNTSPAA